MANRIKIVFSTILVLLVLNFSTIFASSTVKIDLDDFIDKCDYLTEEAKTKIKTSNNYFISAKQDNINYDYIVIKIFDNSLLGFYFTNSSELTAATSEYGSTYNDTFTFDKGYCFQLTGGTRNNSKSMSINNSSIEFFYTEVTLKNVGSFRANRVGLPYPTIDSEYQKNNGTYVIDIANINYLDGYSPAPKLPYFEYNQEIIKDYVTLPNSNVIDGFNYNMTIANNHAIGSLYSTGNDVMLVRLNKYDLKGNRVKDFYRVLYEEDVMINGSYNGYLDMVEVFPDDGYYRFNLYYPKSFMEVNYIYYPQIQKSDGIFLETEPFALFNVNEPVVLPDEEIDDIISGEQNISNGDMLGTITGTLNDLNNNINNTIQNTILGEENESGDRQGGLVGGIIDGITGLFIPDNDYFNNYFTELNDWFSARLGLLYFPFDLIFDFIGRVTSIDFSNPKIEIGPYTFPQFNNVEIVPKLEFKFNDYLENETFKWVHDIYLIIVDALIVFGLVGLIRQKYEEVMTR